jgi:hypothetical protein
LRSFILFRYSDFSYRIESDFQNLIDNAKISIKKSLNDTRIIKTKLEHIKNTAPKVNELFSFKPKNTRRIPSKKHKFHGHYTLNEIVKIDVELAYEIEILSNHFGYKTGNLFYNDPKFYEYTGLSYLEFFENHERPGNYFMQGGRKRKLFHCTDKRNLI